MLSFHNEPQKQDRKFIYVKKEEQGKIPLTGFSNFDFQVRKTHISNFSL